jgi:hypothetical protein
MALRADDFKMVTRDQTALSSLNPLAARSPPRSFLSQTQLVHQATSFLPPSNTIRNHVVAQSGHHGLEQHPAGQSPPLWRR